MTSIGKQDSGVYPLAKGLELTKTLDINVEETNALKNISESLASSQ